VKPPETDWNSRAQGRALAAIALASLVVMAFLVVLGDPLMTEQAPRGIVSFEFAGDAATAHAMMESWGERGRLYAALSLGLDFLFLLLYAAAIALACVRVASRLAAPGTWAERAGWILAWAQPVAAGLDAVENVALIQLLLGSSTPLWAPLAWICAAVKFALVGLGLAYALPGLCLLGVRRVRGRVAGGPGR